MNDVVLYEENSDRKIPSDSYYVVVLKALNLTTDLTDFTKMMLKKKYVDQEFTLVCAYVYLNECHILFSSVEDRSHEFGGSQQAICSDYVSTCVMHTSDKIICNIVEFESRSKIIVYFQTKVFENTKKSVVRLSKVSISKKESNNLTKAELVKALEERAAIKWDNTPSSDRYGTFYKYVTIKNQGKYITISEPIDGQSMDKFTSYFFS
jgi:hypothetical protein